MTLAQWLESLGCFDVKPCKVTIKGTTYEGCDYRQTFAPTAPWTAQEPYTIRALYLLAGSLPACYQRSTKVVFTREDDTRDWYIAGYSASIGRTEFERTPRHWEGSLPEEERKARYEPFGPCFYLHPWNVPSGERIDSHEERPYTRVPMTVAWLSEDEQPTDCDHASVDSLPTLTREEEA